MRSEIMVSQSKLHMWESQMKIQHFAHFDSTTTLKALYCRTFIKSGAHTHCTDVSGIHESTQFVSAPPLMEVLRYSASNTVTWSKHTTE